VFGIDFDLLLNLSHLSSPGIPCKNYEGHKCMGKLVYNFVRPVAVTWKKQSKIEEVVLTLR